MILKDNSAKALADVYKPGRVFSSALSRVSQDALRRMLSVHRA